LVWREPREGRFLLSGGGGVDPAVDGIAELARELAVELAWVAAGDRAHLGGEEAEHDAVLVGGPRRAVAPTERRAAALLAAEGERAVEEPIDEPLEAHRHLEEPPPESRRDQIDHAARD